MKKSSKNVLPPFKIYTESTGEDPRTGLVYRKYKFPDHKGCERTLLFAPGKYKDRMGELVRQLEHVGCWLPLDKKSLLNIIQTINLPHLFPGFTVSSQTGWFGDSDDVFCTPLQIYGKPVMPVETDFGAMAANHKFRRTGTLKDWKKGVARLARGNRIMMFALASAFAGPLLKLLGTESGGFQLVISSSSGKTTCLNVAGSVWGGGPNGFAESWLMTIDALDQMAATYSDTFLGLDETGLAPGSAKQLLTSSYRLCSGEEKKRYTDVSVRRTFRLFFMSTSENAMSELAMREGAGWDPGQLVRFVDIRADGGKGMGVFENLHGAKSPGRFADQLKAAVQQQHGTAGHVYLECLMRDVTSDREGFCVWLKKRMASYERRAPNLGLGRFHERITKRFALVYAAGALAIKYGILPFTRVDLHKAVQFCHRQAIVEALARFAKAEMSGVDVVKAFLLAHESDFLEVGTSLGSTRSDATSVPGFVMHRKSGNEYLVPLKFFQHTICEGHNWRKVLKDLRLGGYLNLNEGGKATVVRTVPTADGPKRKRVISISGRLLTN